MYRVLIIAAIISICASQQTPSDVCLQHAENRSQKDLYADGNDCHRYYQCFFVNETFAIGFHRNCPAGTFYHDQVLSCLPEGAVACQDRCLDDDVSATGSYAGNGCRQYFVCANTASYSMCCPEGTRYVSTGNCEADEANTCNDACTQSGPAIPTSAKPSSQFNATVCLDAYGTHISSVAGESNAYALVDDEGHATTKQYCPAGTSFSLDICRCDVDNSATLPNPTQKRQATVWISFDQNLNDLSVNKFATFAVGGAQRDTTTSAFGGASLYVNGGYLSIPGLKSYDSRKAGSWCAFFRCDGTCSSGGIFSNNKDRASTDYTVILGTSSASNVAGRLLFWHPVGSRSVNGQFQSPSNGWNHVCLTYDSNTIQLYLNGAVAESTNVGGYLAISHYPYIIGNDQGLGTFDGHIDDVLIAPFALTQAEVEAHRNGDRAFLANNGLI